MKRAPTKVLIAIVAILMVGAILGYIVIRHSPHSFGYSNNVDSALTVKHSGRLHIGESNPALEKAIADYQVETLFDSDSSIDREKTKLTYMRRIFLFGFDNRYAYVMSECNGVIYYKNKNIPPFQCVDSLGKWPHCIWRYDFHKVNGKYVIRDCAEVDDEFVNSTPMNQLIPKEVLNYIKTTNPSFLGLKTK